MIIKDILLPGLKTIPLDATLVEAKKIMGELNIRHLPVADGKRVVGLLSDRDIQRGSTPSPGSGDHIPPYRRVSEFMASPVFRMKTTDRVEELVKEMIRQKISSTLIEDESGKDVGIITTQDLLLLLLDKLGPTSHLFEKFKGIFIG